MDTADLFVVGIFNMTAFNISVINYLQQSINTIENASPVGSFNYAAFIICMKGEGGK